MVFHGQRTALLQRTFGTNLPDPLRSSGSRNSHHCSPVFSGDECGLPSASSGLGLGHSLRSLSRRLVGPATAYKTPPASKQASRRRLKTTANESKPDKMARGCTQANKPLVFGCARTGSLRSSKTPLKVARPSTMPASSKCRIQAQVSEPKSIACVDVLIGQEAWQASTARTVEVEPVRFGLFRKQAKVWVRDPLPHGL